MIEQGAPQQQVAEMQQQIQNALNNATQSMLASMQAMRKPGNSGTGSTGIGTGSDAELPEAVMKMGDDWGKLPGEVKNQILQAMKEGYPREFEKMVQVYFRGLAETSKGDDK